VIDCRVSSPTALVAAMRKLITMLNAMLAKNQLWNPKHA